MIINNEKFNEFLQDKNQRQYAEKIKDTKYYFFKIAYDEDCDFIQIMRIYTYHNPEGKPGLKDKSGLGGIYVYSLGLLFNIEYDLREFLSCDNKTEKQNYESVDIEGYYKQLKNEIAAEIVRRIESGQFNRTEAEKLINPDDSDIKYYKEHGMRESAEQDFLNGKQLDKPDICISYTTQCEYDIDAVLEYLRCPADIINTRATTFIETEKVKIYKAIVRAETHFNRFKEIETDKTVFSIINGN